ncbi:hypothetical protein [Flammeovirga agarivorans]|uniref:Uncharacterized protein n=1 Tax=Flammeovirga agarivorans TaxID=2726742 RepID=A0A7X8SNJ1_9BACT|nr:hypothetical protein [Flammeovirga agarivorans]NLR93495.1 hypothetical protein [Flammeovirga agarivorans]
MRKLNYIYISILALLALGCNKDNEEEIPAFSDVSWYTEAGGWAHVNLAREVGQSLSFMDLSQGVYSHEWVLDSGNYYIEGDFVKGDDLTNFIIPDMGLSSDAYNINVLFMEEGLQGVRLHNKFYHPVQYIGYNGSQEYADTLTSFMDEEGMWVIDTTFYVDVYGVIEPEISIEMEGEVLAYIYADSMVYLENGEQKVVTDMENKEAWPTFNIEMGSELTYKDNTTKGRTDTRTWTFPTNATVNGYDNEGNSNLDPENAISVELVFNEFSNSAGGSVEVERSLEVVASKSKVSLPFYITIVPPELKATFKVYHRGVEILHIDEDDMPNEDNTTWPTIDIALDDELVFEDLTNDAVELTRAWNFVSGAKAGETGTEQTETNTYNTLVSGVQIGSFTVSRTINKEEQTSTKVIPLNINVALIQDGDTEVLGDVTTSDEISNTISFFSNEVLQDIPSESINDFAISGNDYNEVALSLSITSVALNPDNKKEVIVTLNDNVYNSDQLQLSYNGTKIMSRAEVPLNSFDKTVVPVNNSAQIINETFKSFEEYKGKDTGGNAKGWISSHDGAPKDSRYFYFQRTDEKASDGEYSMKFFADYDLADISKDKKVETSVNEGHELSVPEGVYEVTVDIFVVDGTITSPADENLEIKLVGDATLAYKVDYNALPRGEWTTITLKKPFGPSNSTSKLVIQFASDVSSSGNVNFYIDNVSMKALQVRP